MSTKSNTPRVQLLLASTKQCAIFSPTMSDFCKARTLTFPGKLQTLALVDNHPLLLPHGLVNQGQPRLTLMTLRHRQLQRNLQGMFSTLTPETSRSSLWNSWVRTC